MKNAFLIQYPVQTGGHLRVKFFIVCMKRWSSSLQFIVFLYNSHRLPLSVSERENLGAYQYYNGVICLKMSFEKPYFISLRNNTSCFIMFPDVLQQSQQKRINASVSLSSVSHLSFQCKHTFLCSDFTSFFHDVVGSACHWQELKCGSTQKGLSLGVLSLGSWLPNHSCW